MDDIPIGPGQPLSCCGGQYGQHRSWCELAVPVSCPAPIGPRDAELAALRARCEDLELIARGFARQLIWRDHDNGGDGWFLISDAPGHITLGTQDGLPLLTNEARRALKGEK